VMPEDPQALPLGKILGHVERRRFRLQAQGMTCEIHRLAAAGIDRMVKLRRKGCERIAGIEQGGARGLGRGQDRQPSPDGRGVSPGAASTVPHTAQVRCSMLEKNR
jgi:hypothetical protein